MSPCSHGFVAGTIGAAAAALHSPYKLEYMDGVDVKDLVRGGGGDYDVLVKVLMIGDAAVRLPALPTASQPLASAWVAGVGPAA